MSQEKVDRYKQEKANRKQIMRKEKIMRWIRHGIMSLIGIVLVVWLGYSAYDKYEKAQPRQSQEVVYDEFNDYINGLTQ